MKREVFDAIDLANTLSVQKLIRDYLAPPFEEISEMGVKIKALRVGNRTGVPQSATSWRYEFSGSGWNMEVRAVWLDGDLMTPLATHCVIELYGLDLETGSRNANKWLRSLNL